MFIKQKKKEFQNMYKSMKNIDEEFVNIKIGIRVLSKLGVNTDKLYEQLDNIGMELYKYKNIILDMMEGEDKYV